MSYFSQLYLTNPFCNFKDKDAVRNALLAKGEYTEKQCGDIAEEIVNSIHVAADKAKKQKEEDEERYELAKNNEAYSLNRVSILETESITNPNKRKELELAQKSVFEAGIERKVAEMRLENSNEYSGKTGMQAAIANNSIFC